MGYALQISQDYEQETCYLCAVVWYMPASFVRNRRNDKGQFFCPNGR